jgi:GAF domain-containing protein
MICDERDYAISDPEKLNGLINVARTIPFELDLEKALKIIVKAGFDLTEADMCNIGLVGKKFWSKMHFYPDQIGSCEDSIDKGIMGWVAKNKKCFYAPDILDNKINKIYVKCREDTKSELACPILYNNEPIGVLNAESCKINAFSKIDCFVLKILADLTTAVVINAKQYEALETLKYIDQKMTFFLDLKETLGLIKERASKLVGTEDVKIRLLEGRKLIPYSGVEHDQIEAATWEIGQCIVGRVAEKKEPMLVNDVQHNEFFLSGLKTVSDPKRLEHLKEIKSEIAVPLLLREKVIGVLNAHSPEDNAFTNHDCSLLCALADQAAIAIETSRLYNDLKDQIEILAGLHKIGSHITNLELKPVLKEITKGLHEIIKADIPLIYLYNEEIKDYDIVYGDIRKDWENECKPRSDGTGKEAIEKDAFIIVNDNINPYPRQKGVKTTAAFPLITKGRIHVIDETSRNDPEEKLGVMYLHFLGEKYEITKDKIDKLEPIILEISLVIKKIITNYRPNENREINKIVERIDEEIENKKIGDRICEIVDADIILIYLYDEDKKLFNKLCYSSIGKGWKDKSKPRASGIGAKAIKHGHLQIADDYSDPDINPAPRRKGVRTSAAVPLIFGDKVLGVIYMHFLAKERIFTENEKKAIETFASNAAIALEKAKSYTELIDFYNIGKEIISNTKMKDVQLSIGNNTCRVAPKAVVHIWLYETNNTWKFFGTTSEDLTLEKHLSKSEPRPNGIGSEVVKTGRPIIIEDLLKYPSHSKKAYDEGIRAIAAFPLMVEKKIIGVIYIHFFEIRKISENDKLRLSMFSNYVAIAINNAMQFENLDRIRWEYEDLKGSNKVNNKLEIMPKDSELQDEVKDLFKKLFLNADTIWISQLIPGFSGAKVVMVKPDYNTVAGREVIVKFGIKEYIEKEEKKFNEYVKWFVGGMQCTTIMASTYSENLGAIVYSLIGHSLKPNDIYSFEKYYKDKTSGDIKKAVKNLFEETCKYWYIKRGGRTGNLVEVYVDELKLDIEMLNNSYKNEDRFKQFVDDGLIQYPDISYDFKNPINWLKSRKLTRALDFSFCITHGDLNKNNILLDGSGNTWLIDFMRTERSHILRDFIRLETTVKFELLRNNISNKAFFEFEKSLLIREPPDSVPTFSDDNLEQEDLEKAYIIIKKIRSMAYHRANEPHIEYNIGLFLQTLKFLTWADVNNKHYILISASIICQALEETGLFERI